MTTNSSFTTSDGVRIAYYVDDFTDPWTIVLAVLVLVHFAAHDARAQTISCVEILFFPFVIS